jgi:serine protease inhibitor
MMIMSIKGFNYNVCVQYNVVSVPYNIDCILCMYMVENKFLNVRKCISDS